ncbi:MAG: hypothetical protein ABFR75_04630 [Acidobacteriota bacterium]
MKLAFYKKILPGRYPITVEENTIKFFIGRKCFGISRSDFMNNTEAPIDCIFEESKKNILYPLQKGVGNHFYFGKYSEIDIIIDFNNLEIKKRFSN